MSTAQQKRFHNKLMELPCVVTNEMFIHGHRNQLHHCAGRRFKLDGMLVGDWYVMPIAAVIHDPRLEREGRFLNVGHRHGSNESKAIFKLKNGPDIDLYDSVMDEYEIIHGLDADVDWVAVELIRNILINFLTNSK